MKLKSIRNVKNLRGKRVFVRVDFNVPMKGHGKILDDMRMVQAIPTLKYLIECGARIIVGTHLGRPEGKIVSSLRLDDVSRHLANLLGKQVCYVQSSTGEEVVSEIVKLEPGDVLLLENLRFEHGEEENDQRLAKFWASFGHIYVNEAFSNSHRKHASMVGIPRFISAYAGLNLSREVEILDSLMVRPKRPFVVFIGGVKLESKLAMLRNLTRFADAVYVGGGVANTVLAARGYGVGKSLVEKSFIPKLRGIVQSRKIITPIDVMTAATERANSARTYDVAHIPKDVGIYDIGPQTLKLYTRALVLAETVVWAGPFGYFENGLFAFGTKTLTETISESRAFTVCGGGETIEAIDTFASRRHFSYISTGGSAMIEYLGGKTLPALVPLMRRRK